MSWWKPHYFWSVIAMIALIIIGFVVWSNFRQMQADAAATAATGMMRLGMVPEPVRAPMPEWDTHD
jgi:ABC-type polysaccharide/polyol phosphate export permease